MEWLTNPDVWIGLLTRNLAAHDGADLAERIAEWQRQGTTPDASSDLHLSDFPRTIVSLSIQHTQKDTQL